MAEEEDTKPSTYTHSLSVVYPTGCRVRRTETECPGGMKEQGKDQRASHHTFRPTQQSPPCSSFGTLSLLTSTARPAIVPPVPLLVPPIFLDT